jgi:two-component system cell cycle response regulator
MGARVLIIEDNLSNLELMTYLLSSFGHAVSKAENGESGLKAAQSAEFDVVLCDIQLPDVGGEEIARRLKASARTAKMPLVAVTALAMLGDRDRLISKGFDGYIAKPINPETFVPQVESFAQIAISAPKRAITGPALAPKQWEGQRGTILVLDDSADGRYFFRIILEPEGYCVHEASRIEAAIQLCQKIRPDLVLADMNLSHKEDGEDFLLRIKKDDELKGIPVILVTSSSSPSKQLIERIKQEGAVDLVLRPISPKDIIKVIHSALCA